jgi:hypothetical protein
MEQGELVGLVRKIFERRRKDACHLTARFGLARSSASGDVVDASDLHVQKLLIWWAVARATSQTTNIRRFVYIPIDSPEIISILSIVPSPSLPLRFLKLTSPSALSEVCKKCPL